MTKASPTTSFDNIFLGSTTSWLCSSRIAQGVFTPAEFSAFNSNSGLFSHLVWFICTGVNTITAVGYGQKQPHQRSAFMV